LHNIGIKYLTQLFIAALLKGYFRAQWKVTHIIILKPGKPPNELSYRPICLLPIVSKFFEKLFLRRHLAMVENSILILDHQFDIRQRHSTIEQTHRIVIVTTLLQKKLEKNID
jgi:hypothetical protein